MPRDSGAAGNYDVCVKRRAKRADELREYATCQLAVLARTFQPIPQNGRPLSKLLGVSLRSLLYKSSLYRFRVTVA